MKTLSPTFLLLFAVAATALGQTREFTSATGQKLAAELVGYADGVAQLKLANGKTVPLQLSKLSEADREYVDLWATDPSRNMSNADMTMDDYLAGLGYDSVLYNDEKSSAIIEITFGDVVRKFMVNTNLPYSYIDLSLIHI